MNQVQGKPFCGACINPFTRNDSDGGGQCVKDGPDQVSNSIRIPVMQKQKLTKSLIKGCLTAEVLGIPDLYVSNITRTGTRRQCKRAKKNKLSNSHQ